jgi:parallel beta-helix repeat protein
VRFVNVNSTNPVAPYTSWSTAATNIQAALDSSGATANDTVLVSPGVYHESVNFNGNSVWLLSASGPANTIINPPAGYSAVSFGSGEGSNSILWGFTLTNGGVSVGSSSPTIMSNVLVNCGTGIDCEFASPYILNNLINGCSGDAIYLGGADTVYIAGNLIQNNGGGIGMWASGSPTIINNVIQNNRGTAIGMVNQCDANIIQNLIVNNNGDGINAAVPSGARCPWIINNTIYGNSGNGIWEDGFVAGGEIINNIVVGSPALNMNPWYGGPPPTVQFNDFYSTNGIVYSGVVTNVNSSNGDISSDPLFASAAGGDFHLATGSPCVDAGTNGAPLLPPLDLDGYTRIIAGISNGPAIADLGVYELRSSSFIAIQSQPVSLGLVGGQNALFSVAAASPLPLTYQWQLNTTNLPGATNASLFIADAQSKDAGIYDVVVSNGAASVTSSNAILTVAYPPPTILMQPAGVALLAGNNVAFSCVVTGYFAMQFQWQLNGTNLVNGGRISGATSTNLNLTGVVTNDSGNYQLVIADSYHSVTSSVAPLTVWQAPAFLSPPADTVASVFGSCALSVTVTGAPPVTLQWQKNGINLTDGGSITGSGTASLTISNLQFTGAGQYGVVVSNAFGTATDNCTLTVLPIVLWGYAYDSLPAAATNALAIAVGGDIASGQFDMVLRADETVVAWGSGAYGSTSVPAAATNVVAIAAGDYHGLALRQDGTVVGWGSDSYGESTPPASATNVVAMAAGEWHSLALRQDGTVVGWGDNGWGKATPPANATNVIAISAGGSFSLALRQDGTVVGWGDTNDGEALPPADATNIVAIAAGHSHGLALRADGTVEAWGYNGYGETMPPPNATNVVAIAAGNAVSLALRQDGTVVAWGDNAFGETNPPANLTNVVAISAREFHGMALVQNPAATNPPVIVRQPVGGTPQTGQTFIMEPLVTGAFPLGFQWYYNGAPLAGQTNDLLALVAINTNQAGNYQVLVTNNFGAVTSQVAVISETPGIIAQPVSQLAFISNSVAFAAAVTGIGPIGYQWYFNGAPLADSTRISGSASSSLTLSNLQMSDAGSYVLIVTNTAGSTTTAAVLLTVASQPANQTVLQGSNVSIPVTTNSPVPLAFQWLENGNMLTNGARIGGATSPTLTISSSQTGDSGAYQVVITNRSSSITSMMAALTVLAPAAITTQPSSQAVLIGGTATFTATATGSSLNYLWFDNGVPLSDNGRISGSATPTLNIINVQSNDAGGYVLFISNALSSTASLTASLTPLTLPGQSVRYVNLNNPNPLPPYLGWSTAATNIQDAIDAAVAGDSILVTNGVYQTGGRVVYGSLTNRVVINKPVTVQSVNGPTATTIRGNRPQGNNAVRCVYLTNNAVLTGFTLLGGGTRTTGDTAKEQSGGGAWCESTNARLIGCLIVSNVAWFNGGGEFFGALSNCTLAGNTATNGSGGGACSGILNSCVLSNNFAQLAGGGACSNILNGCMLIRNVSRGISYDGNSGGGGAVLSLLNNCTVIGNLSSGGGGAGQCTLNFCTISSNTASSYGGGVYSCVVNDCVLAGNVSTNSGGGAYESTLNNCLLWGNHTFNGAGAAWNCTLNNCTVAGNLAGSLAGGGLGGTSSGTARNCIIYYNSGQNSYTTYLTNCCTTPLPFSPYTGANNFTNPPLFVNTNSDFHLQSNSPCINAGNNAYVINATDLDGNPRIVGGTLDLGAYEYQTPASVISYAWLQQYGLPTDGTADYTDTDGTGMNNWQKWLAGLNPTNPASVLAMSPPVATNNSAGITVSWQSVNTRRYYLQRATNLASQPAFSSIQSNIVGQAGTTRLQDTTATNAGPYFYRVGVQ